MSALAGIYHLDGRSIDERLLQQMVDCLAHRGADGSGVWCQGSIGLGQRSLSTTPESIKTGPPLPDERGERILAADARIDNRDELISALSLDDRAPGSISDEELILKAYGKWGENCPEKLIGDFAFALWDGPERKIFCARDHMGVRCLYYHHSDQFFVFASEIKALLLYPDVPCQLNEGRVADYLAMVFEDKENTFYQDIFRLPPGSCMTVKPEGIQKRIYWSLDPSKELHLDSNEDYTEAFREILTKAIQCRLRCNGRPGFLLSGGLDSSSLICMARDWMRDVDADDLISFSATFPDFPKVDEQVYIDLVLEGGRIEANYIRADRLSPLQDIERVYRHMDEPFHAPNFFVYWALAQTARERSVNVLIDGIDGDTTVSHGLEILRELLRAGRLGTFFSELKWLSRRFQQPRRRFLWHYGLRPLLVESVEKWRGFFGRKGAIPVAVPSTVNTEFAKRIGWNDRYRGLLGHQLKPAKSYREEHWRHLTSGLISFTLEVNNKAAAAFGLDQRHPFFDKRLVEFCLAIPSEQKLNQGWDRVIQRRAVEKIVPEKIQQRTTKSEWGPVFKRGMMDFGRESLESVVHGEPGMFNEFVNPLALRAAYERCRSGSISISDGMNVWLAITLAMWLRKANTGILKA